MARDPTELDDDEPHGTDPGTTDNGGNDPLLGRRSYLTMAGTAAATTVAAVGSAAASSDYDVVEVPAGGTHSIRLNDGDTLENVLIDISARGAEYNIHAVGNDITIRNVGVRGQWDNTSQTSPLIMAVPDPNSTSRIENVYLGDGARGNTYPNGPTGIFVAALHAGTIEIDSVNIQDMPDNAVYASSPGNPPRHPNTGNDGVVRITNSYAADCNAGGFRIGTDGSSVENCVMVNNDRNFWGYFNETDVRDSDMSGGRIHDVRAGARAWNTSSTVRLENCRFETTNTATRNDRIVGSSQGTPRTEPPESAPRSPEEAAAGESGDGDPNPPSEPDEGDDGDDEPEEEPDDGDDDPTIEDAWEDDGATHLVLEGGSGGVSEYEFVGRGDAEPGDDANTNSDDPYRDTVTRDGDEFVIEGYLGGYRDDFYVDGRIDSVSADSDVTAIVNGYEFDPADLEGVGSWDGGEDEPEDDEDQNENEDGDDDSSGDLPHVLLFDGTEASGPTTYSFTIDGTVEPAEYMGATIDDETEIEGTTVRGIVANWRDAYRFDGDITDFRLVGDAEVHLEYDVDD
ncbi:right-handed parallel beta-helix repeat-containing protein [Halobiforma nitratireducens]|uniref:Right handed beta helix domain-containing protein n=1 Tax=Halobiforma nitratireducens JCM 10879 TaxID=1227454 RepID=M0LZV8_9EURY|nr:right-handed parallel beta-helix repeat-containing protein [Halobiforma nitratireducens]EMA38961.1 hypothetical protein C446_09223 [Halobiforma nitratireducens JCM 10879]